MRDTAHLSEVEECIYSRLIDTYYSRERALPVDEAQCCRLVRAQSKQSRAAVASILREFFELRDDGWHQKRCDAELAKYAEKSAKATQSASVRWSERNANAMRTHSEGNANQEPITNNQNQGKTKTKHAPTALPDWMPPEVWQEWAKHRGGKLTAQAATRQLAKLAEFRRQGHDPPGLVGLAIERGWASFFLPKDGPVAAKHDARRQFGETIWGANDERTDERVIDGEAQRVA